MPKDTRLYDTLGIGPASTDAEIKKAYRLMALKNHPDKNNHSKESTEKFQEITQAYRVLSDPNQKCLYDKFGTEGLNGNGKAAPTPNFHFNPNDLFNQFFGESFMSFNSFNHGNSLFNNQFQQKQRKGPDINHQLACSLEDLYTGKKTKLGLRRTELCQTCHAKGGFNVHRCSHCRGTGIIVMRSQMGHIVHRLEKTCNGCKGSGEYILDVCGTCQGAKVVEERRILTVDIQPGSKDGDLIILDGEGDQGLGILPGNVVVTIVQKHHQFFVRNSHNLFCEAKIDLSTAIIGGSFTIRHLNGSYLNVKISKGEIIRPNSFKIIKGYGMPIDKKNFGDLIVHFSVTFPSQLSSESMDLLAQALPKMEPSINVPMGAPQIPVVLTESCIPDGQYHNFHSKQSEENGHQSNKRRKECNGTFNGSPGENDVQCTSQ